MNVFMYEGGCIVMLGHVLEMTLVISSTYCVGTSHQINKYLSRSCDFFEFSFVKD